MKTYRTLWITLLVGLGLRLICAFFVYGPQALDDYKHGVLPAYQWAAGLDVDLPGYRNFVLVWFLGAITKIGSLLGVDSALSQVRLMYAGLAFWSLLAWVAVGAYARNRVEFGRTLWFLLAVYPLMPFISTRAFGEAMALPLVLTGLLACEVGRENKSLASRWLPLGFLALGVASYFRFQVGIIYVALMLIYLFTRYYRGVMWAGLVGLVLVAGQVFIDIQSGREPFGTLRNYLSVNEGGAVQYGTSPWYNTWVLVAGLLLIPLSLGFGNAWGKVLKRHWRILLPVGLFILAHSLTPHKEERFMYPIVGVLLLMLADLWAEKRRSRFARRIFAPVSTVIIIGGLLITCLNNTQVGEVGPVAVISQSHPAVAYLDKESLLGPSRIKGFFVRPPSEVFELQEDVTTGVIDQWLTPDRPWTAIAILTSDPLTGQKLKLFSNAETERSKCEEVESASSLVDRVIYHLNPKHNQRRRPTWYLVCERRAT